MLKKNIFSFLFWLLITFLAGFIGSFFTTKSIASWYQFLKKPVFAPPNWIFVPVWSILYFLMAISAFLIWKKRKETNVREALTFYFIQLILNTFWSIVFFGLKSPLFGFLEILVLWIFILLTTLKFYKIDKLAGYLLIPYILWVSFAGILNLFVWILN
jgi:tryptophan-rich sensory protein